MKRRDALKTFSIGALAATAGRLGGFEQQSAWRDPPLIDDRPDAVYLPAVVGEMKMYGKTAAGPYSVAPTYSYPHRSWTAAGSDPGKTVIEANDSIHLMASLQDTGTETVLPLDAGVSIETLHDGDLMSEEVAYLMLSQQMGMYYGSNYVLNGRDDYETRTHIGGTSLSRTGSLAGRFESAETVAFKFAFDTGDLYDVELCRLDDRAGSRGTVPAMEMMGVPTGKVPAVSNLPDRHLGQQTSADALFDAFIVDDGSCSGVDGAYLYILTQTLHNEFVLSMVGVRAALEHDGTTALDDTRLARTLDSGLDYHCGTDVEDVESGDTLTLSADVPPQVTRHDGYETAFTASEPMRFEV